MTLHPVPSSYTAVLVLTMAYSKTTHSTYCYRPSNHVMLQFNIYWMQSPHCGAGRARGRWRAIGAWGFVYSIDVLPVFLPSPSLPRTFEVGLRWTDAPLELAHRRTRADLRDGRQRPCRGEQTDRSKNNVARQLLEHRPEFERIADLAYSQGEPSRLELMWCVLSSFLLSIYPSLSPLLSPLLILKRENVNSS